MFARVLFRPFSRVQIAALLSLISLCGCGSSPKPHFFALASIPGGSATGPAPAGPVQVAAVHLPASLDRQEIVRETAANALDFGDENRWGAPLDEMTRRVLTQDLVQRMPRGSVILPDEPAPVGTRRIVVTALEFEPTSGGEIKLEGSWSLIARDANVPTLTRSFQISQRTNSNGYDADVRAMSIAIGRLADDIAAGLRTSPPA